MRLIRALFLLVQILIVKLNFGVSTFPSVMAQEYMGMHSSGWGGIQAMINNPANVVDSRIKYDIHLFSLDAFVTNNALYLSRGFESQFNGGNLDSVTRIDTIGLNKGGFARFRFQFPSLMLKINEKNAIGLSIASRGFARIDRMPGFLFRAAYEGNDSSTGNIQSISHPFTSAQIQNWTEFGLTYGRVVREGGPHSLKWGASLKGLIGSNMGFTYIDDLNIQYQNDTIVSLQGEFRYGYNRELDTDNQGTQDLFSANGYGIAMDLGIVYEWRPNVQKHTYELDGKSGLWRKNVETYVIRAGISVLDFGFLSYTSGIGSRTLRANLQNVPISYFDGVENSEDVITKLSNHPDVDYIDMGGQVLNVGLPTSLMTSFDWQAAPGLFINVSAALSLSQFVFPNRGLGGLSMISLTPRYENSVIGIYIPVSYHELGQFNWGGALRIGPFFTGSNHIFSNLMRSEFAGTDFYMGIKIPIRERGPKDRDKDGVSDALDRCPDRSGAWRHRGCPDTDGDGIPDDQDECVNDPGPSYTKGCPDTDGDRIADKDDECPFEAGPKNTRGCPDQDGDGIPDYLDKCPLIAGIELYSGCPDSDGDGIPDPDDECPNLAGILKYNGCPDSDGDGVPDHIDECPNIIGLIEFQGCLDRDGDGINDSRDRCPDLFGVHENLGCPWADSDGDGVPDEADSCPLTPGLVELKGCPDFEKDDAGVMKTAFENLEFATGKGLILSKSYPSLNALAELMKEKSGYHLFIEGHTDNIGERELNLKLSESRALAVKSYLIRKGVPSAQIHTEFYGPDRPIADNESEEGRQKNRRVEFKMTFK
jgi:outer membrane protein OmpA-like peptidoglycan-associated protein